MTKPHVIYLQSPIYKMAKFIVFDQIKITPQSLRPKIVKVNVDY